MGVLVELVDRPGARLVGVLKCLGPYDCPKCALPYPNNPFPLHRASVSIVA